MKIISTILLFIACCIVSFYMGSRINSDVNSSYRSSKTSADNMVLALKLNKDINNSALVSHLTTHLETSLLGVINKFNANPDDLNDFQKEEVIKLIIEIDNLIYEKKLSFLSNPNLSDEFIQYLRNGIEQIKRTKLYDSIKM